MASRVHAKRKRLSRPPRAPRAALVFSAYTAATTATSTANAASVSGTGHPRRTPPPRLLSADASQIEAAFQRRRARAIVAP
jgi:hypothetical protein